MICISCNKITSVPCPNCWRPMSSIEGVRKQRIKDLESENNKLFINIAEMNTANQYLIQKLEQAKKSREEAIRAQCMIREAYDKEVQENATLREELEELKAKCTRLDESNEDFLKEQNESLMRKNRGLEIENLSLRKGLSACQAQVKELGSMNINSDCPLSSSDKEKLSAFNEMCELIIKAETYYRDCLPPYETCPNPYVETLERIIKIHKLYKSLYSKYTVKELKQIVKKFEKMQKFWGVF